MHKHFYQGEIISLPDTYRDIIDIKYYSESDIIDIKGREAILQLKHLEVSSVSLVSSTLVLFMQILC